MKALSVRQPWAEFIADGRKPLETRSRPTSYRGQLAVHASLRDDYTGTARTAWEDHWTGQGRPLDEAEHAFDALPRGRLVAMTNLVDCQPFLPEQAALAMTPWRPHVFGWSLRDVRRVDSVLPVRGQLGIWEIPASILKELPA